MANRFAQETALDREPDFQILRRDQFRPICGDRCRGAGRFCRQKHLRVRVLGVVKDLGRGAGLHDLTILHHADAVGKLTHDPKVMGDEQQPHAFGLFFKLRQKLQNLRLNGHIQRRRRLIRNQDVRLVRQRHGDHDPLSLTAPDSWCG